ncbi:MAG: metallophosphoesterase [Bacteroidales bacterium]
MPWPLRMISYAGILLLILLIYFAYRYFKSVKILDLKPVWLYRVLYFIPAGLFISYPVAGHIQFWTQGTFSRTGFPDVVVYLYWFGVVCMGIMLNLLVLHDLLRPLTVRFSSINEHKLKRFFARTFLIVAGLTVLYTAGRMIRDTTHIVVDEIAYAFSRNSMASETLQLSEPLTIVHIADLHADKYTGEKKMSRYIRKVNEAKPDIVIFAGDLISSGLDYVESGADALADIKSTYGTYFVMGDHDYWSGTDEIAEAIHSRGIHVLQNENALVRHGESLIKITGVTELYSYQIDSLLLHDLLHEETGEDLHLVASHQASKRIIMETLNSGVHQLLAGHTHGGQIRVPLFFYPVSAARTESSYVKGHWLMGDMLLNINSGLGFTLVPLRYKAPAQVSVIKVQ